MTPLRSRVGKYAAVLDFFTEVKLPENCIAEAIESIGGVDAAHQAALRTRRMRLVPAPDMSGEQQEGETGTGFGGGYIKFPHRSRGDLAEVAALELGVVDGTKESAVVSRLTRMLADLSALGFEVESIPKKRESPFAVDNTHCSGGGARSRVQRDHWWNDADLACSPLYFCSGRSTS
jgi:hypothetical protein